LTVGVQSKRIGDRLRAELGNVIKALILEIDANLREATPVDTGHARANWVPSIGAPHVGEDTGAAHEQGVQRVLGYKLDDGPAFESNRVPYINSLNYGHSKQAPRMFIEAAVDKAVATIQQRYSVAIDVSSLNELRGAIGLSRALLAFR